MTYVVSLLMLAVFTGLDILATGIGLRIGCIELNPIVTTWGFATWAFFRLILIGEMLVTFSFARKLLFKYSLKASKILEWIVLLLNFFIAVVFFFGVLAIFLKLLS